ncbi:hypothetical protein [Microbacterium sp. VKM Ac-2923]|uniref:hypothetical protein n=1 Tax=Microbacterium sp. VKM Ac-2923 TaxID=2929476 RepID=UPI001FB222B0|nr:hypothetical protein [Microbacterium sp. VKM Ac-2923]MCJ1707945.1 hypothetical protein [Microbacterium sp. VKM Ac-2923]
MTDTTLPLTDPTGTRREAFLALVRDEDIMHSLDNVPDDTLVNIGLGLAVEAYENRWEGTRGLAVTRFGVPSDVIELLAAAALAALLPTMGAVILARPNEATLANLRAWLASHGFRATPTRRSGSVKGRRR